MKAKQLILNGDVFDSIDFRRLKKHHWKILSELPNWPTKCRWCGLTATTTARRRSCRTSSGVECADEIIVESGGRKILFLHGHRFDEFISHVIRFSAWMADRLYHFLQWIDKSHYFAKLAKQKSKTFLRCAPEDPNTTR